MTERPILFSGAMVRALLAGTKTQTRRVVKWRNVSPGLNLGFSGLRAVKNIGGYSLESDTRTSVEDRCAVTPCPYGQPGDRLWVKETWRTAKSLDSKAPAAIGEMCINAGYRKPWAPLAYEADGHRNSEWRGFELDGDAQPGKTRVSIHMPRWASRITLEVTEVRVERLQSISEADAIAEGAGYIDVFDGLAWHSGYRAGYEALWHEIYGPGSWAANPWVWAVSSKVVKGGAL